jgi:hypothetical protein
MHMVVYCSIEKVKKEGVDYSLGVLESFMIVVSNIIKPIPYF